MKQGDITKEIIGASMAALTELKPGLDEKLYENAPSSNWWRAGTRSNSKGSILVRGNQKEDHGLRG